MFRGSTTVDRSLYEYRYPVGEQIEIAYGSFVIKSDEESILVDSGLPGQEEIHRIGLSFDYMNNPPLFAEEFEKIGVRPDIEKWPSP
jgi:hypothetical protein